MFDQHHGGAEVTIDVGDEPGHFLFFLGVHPGHRFIQQQQGRPGDQRPAQLDALLQTVGQVAHRHITQGLQLQQLQNVLGLAPKRLGLAPRPWQAQGLFATDR